MATRVIMPKLGMTMTEGTVVQWRKKEGDRVEKGEVILEIMSEKIEYEVEASESGILSKIMGKEEEVYPIGTTLAVIVAEGEKVPEEFLKAAPSVAEVRKPGPPPKVVARGQAAGTREIEAGGRIKASPAARALAQEMGVDVEALVGTGPGGRIVKEDVIRVAQESKITEAAAPAGPATGGIEVLEVIPLKGVRRVIAERMQQSWEKTPRVTEVMEVDMTACEAFRRDNLPGWEKGFGVRVTINDIIVRATALALKEHPLLNSTIANGEVRKLKEINIGVAVAMEEGLIVPVVQRAHEKTLIEIARQTRDLADRAREGKLTPDDVARHTFSITNLGAFGVEIFTPIVNFPDNAILGVGKVAKRPVVVGDAITVRSMMYLSLVFNHKVVDGVPAARFLARLKEILEDPEKYLQ